jgi:hypothetical protein
VLFLAKGSPGLVCDFRLHASRAERRFRWRALTVRFVLIDRCPKASTRCGGERYGLDAGPYRRTGKGVCLGKHPSTPKPPGPDGLSATRYPAGGYAGQRLANLPAALAANNASRNPCPPSPPAGQANGPPTPEVADQSRWVKTILDQLVAWMLWQTTLAQVRWHEPCTNSSTHNRGMVLSQ